MGFLASNIRPPPRRGATAGTGAAIDLHARQMYVCLMDRHGHKLVHTNIKNNDFNFFLKLVAPYRHDLTVCAECMGSPKAITAMAHKLARVLWHLLKYKQPYNPEVFAKEEQKLQRKKLARLHNMAATLNYQLIPIQ